MTADLGSAATIGLRKISEIDRLLWTLGVLAVAAVAYVYGLKLNTNGYWIGVIPFGGPRLRNSETCRKNTLRF
jgi:hypothetical protein